MLSENEFTQVLSIKQHCHETHIIISNFARTAQSTHYIHKDMIVLIIREIVENNGEVKFNISKQGLICVYIYKL